MPRKNSCLGCNMAIDNTTTFLHSFFFGSDTYSADVIDRKVEQFVVQFCLDNHLIDVVWNNDARLYRLLPEGKRILPK